MALLDGRVALVTGAGRGIGREEALLLAKHGAAVVVNDLGGGFDGSGKDVGPAQEVVNEIKKMGGKAVANGDSVSDFKGAKRMVECAIDTFGSLEIVRHENVPQFCRVHAKVGVGRRFSRNLYFSPHVGDKQP